MAPPSALAVATPATAVPVFAAVLNPDLAGEGAAAGAAGRGTIVGTNVVTRGVSAFFVFEEPKPE
jgi:hypothetical protein